MKFDKKILGMVFVFLVLAFTFKVLYNTAFKADKVESHTSEQSAAPRKIKVYVPYSWWNKKDWGNDITSQELTKITGISLDIETPSSFIEENSRINLMLATNEYPDIMLIEKNGFYKKLINNNVLLPLDGLIEKYGPDIKKFTTMKYLNTCREEDNKLYGLPNQYIKNSSGFLTSGQAFAIRKKLYEQLGSPKIDTLEDFYKYLVKIKQSGIKVDGKNIIPLSVAMPYALFAGAFGSNVVNINDGFYTVKKDGLVSQILRDPKMKECYRFINKLFNEKLLDQDELLQTADEGEAKIKSGEVAVIGHTNAFVFINSANVAISKVIKDEEFQIIKTPGGPGIINAKQTFINSRPWDYIVITKSCKDPEKVMKFLNYLSSDVGQITSRIGPMGKVWNMVKGKPVITKEYIDKLKKDKAGTYAEIGYDKWNWLGDNAYDYVYSELLTGAERVKQEKYRKIIEKESWHYPGIDKIVLDLMSPEGIAFSKVKPIFKKYSDMLIMAKDKNTFEKLYSDAIRDMDEVGLKKVENEINRQIKLKTK